MVLLPTKVSWTKGREGWLPEFSPGGFEVVPTAGACGYLHYKRKKSCSHSRWIFEKFSHEHSVCHPCPASALLQVRVQLGIEGRV